MGLWWMNQMDLWQCEPLFDAGEGVTDGQGVFKNFGMGGDADEAENDDPCKSDAVMAL